MLALVRCPQHGVFQSEIMSSQTAGVLAHADVDLSTTSMLAAAEASTAQPTVAGTAMITGNG